MSRIDFTRSLRSPIDDIRRHAGFDGGANLPAASELSTNMATGRREGLGQGEKVLEPVAIGILEIDDHHVRRNLDDPPERPLWWN